ncbi:unnamed protein product [Caenorhabditis angaria]|uniref:FYVE-type domain-containing protein n=1 Tax=Caenorhabditis angaria TaxID=860376 RepID=A0A9P1IQ00_9PELO|nr:unnamed protein product [Caenorhabditis angaria]
MNIFSNNGPFSLLYGGTDEGQKLTRAQVIHRDNERANLETICRLVIRALLEDAMESSNRLIEGDSQTLSDLLMMLEKVLFHGFKSSMKTALIALRTPDAELWTMIQKIGRTSEILRESVQCIDRLESLITPISKIRAILRLTMMQKKLSDLFDGIINFSLIKDFYESYAFLRQEKAVVLSGALVGLRVIECNLVLEYDNLQEQPLSVDLSMYVKLPTISNTNEPIENGNLKDNERKRLLDQNNFLEERIRYLEANLEETKRKVEVVNDSNSSISIDSFSAVSYRRPSEDDRDNENEKLISKIVELEDTNSHLQEQVNDKSKVCTDLYDKLRLSEECIRKLETDFLRLKSHYEEDKNALCKEIEHLQIQKTNVSSELDAKQTSDEELRVEFQKKCEQYNTAIANLEEKQKLLVNAETEIIRLESELKEMPALKKEKSDLGLRLRFETERANENEKALEELGGRLSESKLRMIELTEELLPKSDAQWAKDSDVSNCTACTEVFSMTKRKHHCRMCGSIFCANCSEGRVKLPSNPRPARVCDICYNILKTRNNPTMSARLLRNVLTTAAKQQQRTMYENPYINRFKARSKVSEDFHKKSTGITGLFVNENPHRALTVVYGRILRAVEQMPQDSAYRKYTEAIVKQRLALVQSEDNIERLEQKIGMGQIEEVIEQAELELETTRNILDSKAWEPLVEAAPKGQWAWPV